MRRIDTPDDTAWLHGVVAADGSAALMSYVQLEPPPHDRPVALRGGPVPSGLEVPGAVLAGVGVDLPVLRPLTAAVLHLEAL